MNELIIKQFEGNEIRSEKDKNGTIWFIAKDVLSILGIKNTSMAMRKLKKEEKKLISIYTLGGDQDLSAVTESGLYALIFQSRKKKAEEFRYWVTNEVLPNLRTDGAFSLKEIDPLDQLKMHVAVMEKQREEIKRLNSSLEAVAIEARQDDDTLTHVQISELDRLMNNKYKELGLKDYRIIGLMKRALKNEFFEITGSRTWKELPRRGYMRAVEIINTFKIPEYLK